VKVSTSRPPETSGQRAHMLGPLEKTDGVGAGPIVDPNSGPEDVEAAVSVKLLVFWLHRIGK
jgi:hypothetical protein